MDNWKQISLIGVGVKDLMFLRVSTLSGKILALYGVEGDSWGSHSYSRHPAKMADEAPPGASMNSCASFVFRVWDWV